MEEWDAVILGAGPAGLAAAEVTSAAGLKTLICEAKPTVGRKFLMAGKSGLNLTKSEPADAFLSAFAESADWMAPMIAAFGPQEICAWAEGLGQPVFTGTTGRVFPRAMKASPLLRAWVARLESHGAQIRTRWRWTGWSDGALRFDTSQGTVCVKARSTILALGGASWSRLGSDGLWTDILGPDGVSLATFAPTNAALNIPWSAYMQPHFGAPLKSVCWRCGDQTSRGEAVVSGRGLEGGGIYAINGALRSGAPLILDLAPDRDADDLAQRLAAAPAKMSHANRLRKILGFDAVKRAIAQEFGRPAPKSPKALAEQLKHLQIHHAGLRPIDEAISVAGGVRRHALDKSLMLNAKPGVFCCGEMLDWEAPTGGYLLTGCLATGRWAGAAAVDYATG